MKNRFSIIIAGGKTGGHLFPGIAVAQALEAACPHARILFVGTRTPFEKNTLARYGYAHRGISAKPIKGKSLVDKATSLGLVLLSLAQSFWIIRRFKPDLVLGVGGYSSFSVVLAARIMGLATAIQEQNSIPGMTNRFLSRFVTKIFTGFETTCHMPENKILYTGNPIRRTSQMDGVKEHLDLDPANFVVLATGGSQGAASINRACMEAIEALAHEKDLFLVHQTGAGNEEKIREVYATKNAPALARAFFHDMATLQNRADLVVARAGAGTLSELCLAGKPAILVPFPHAADDHQTFNAKAVADRGGAILVKDNDLSGQSLAKIILDLKKDPKRLARMSQAMKGLAMPRAADVIAAHILELKRG